MADIDSLLISVTADSEKAQSSLDSLAGGLERMASAIGGVNASSLTDIANGISAIATAMQGISGIDKRSFTSLASKFNELNKIDGAKLQQTALTLQDISSAFNGLNNVAIGSTGNIAELVNAVGNLGSARVGRAVAQIPQLGTALRDLFTTLSTAPTVSQNVIQMTTALGNLASQGQRIGSATRSINSNLKSTSSATKTASVGFAGLTSAIGKFYAKYFLVVRGVKALGNAIEKSMDYTETYNYWNVALDKIQKQYGSDYKRWTEYYGDMGMASAESYAKSFETRLKELTKKMSGNTIGDNGELLIGNDIGLGLDAEQLLNFQAKIMGVTNSVGLLGETSINTAKAMSMLAGDLSSLTNQDISTVMQNLQSGLIGQSRVLYKYGIDITNATLAEIALTHGIQKKVSAMSQSEKMQLRVLAILDQSKVAWADQANTINSVANQYRIFKQQISNLGRTLGNLLLPIVKTILPYVNALIIVMQKLFQTLGFKLYGDSWLKDLQDGISGGAGDLDDGLDDVGDNLDGISDKVDKLKKQLQGFDELNNLTSNDDSSSSGDVNLGGGFDLSDDIADALSEYEKVWNEALEKAKNKATEIANAILNAFNKFKESDFYKSMEKLFGTLKDFTKVSFKALYDFYDKFLKPVGKWVGNKVIKKLVDLFVDFYKKINWKSLIDALSKMWQVLSKFTINIGQGFLDFVSLIAGFALDVLAGTINLLAKALEFVFDCLLAVPDDVLYAIGVALGVIFTAFALSKLPVLIATVATAFTTFGTAIMTAGTKLIEFVALNPTLVWATVLIASLALVVTAVKELQDGIDAFTMENIVNAMSGEITISEYADALVNDFNNISAGFSDLVDKTNGIDENNEKIEDVTGKIKELFSAFDNGANIKDKLDELVGYFDTFFEESKQKFQQIYLMIVGSLTGAIDEATTEEQKQKYQDYIDTITGAFNSGNDSFENATKRMNELAEQYSNGDIDYSEYVTALSELATQYGMFKDIDLSGATEQIENLHGALDFTDILGDDGFFDKEKWEDATSQISTAYTEGTDAIIKATDSAKKNAEEWIDTWVDASQREEVKAGISALYDEKQAKAIEEYNTKLQEFTNNLETQCLQRIPQIVEQAQEDYSKFNFFQKLLYPTEEDYITKVLKDHETKTINPFVEGINKILEQTVGETAEKADWVKTTYVDMFNAGFENAKEEITASPYITSLVDGTLVKLSDDWKSKMSQVMTDEIEPSMYTLGEDVVAQFSLGVGESDTSGAVNDLVGNLEDEVIGQKSLFEQVGELMADQIIGGFMDTFLDIDFSISPNSKGNNGSSSLPKYATGGFPEDGLFMANHGELVGKFANGKTAVANNEQIEKGIANAVYNAIVNAGGFGGGNVSIRLEGDAKGLFRAVQEGAEDYTNRTGRQAFSF